MPSINNLFLSKLKDDYTKYSCFIETGTYLGETILALEPYFNKLLTIEYSDYYYNYTKNKYNGNKIDFILGDSRIIFENILPSFTEKCIFFLDAHYSGGNTGRCEIDVPLIKEITLINNLFKNEAIIIIDDFRLFNTYVNEDWSNINKDDIINILKPRISNIYHLDSECAKNDRLIIHINAI